MRMGPFAACTIPTTARALADGETSARPTTTVSETIEADVVVVGAGASGLSAANEAADLGARVVLLESQETAGGNANMVVGIMGIGSELQEEQGIPRADPMVYVRHELETFAFGVDSRRWVDLFEASGANMDWLVQKGVAFGEITTHNATCPDRIFHTFSGTLAQPLYESALAAGVDVHLGAEAYELCVEDGRVTGVLSNTADGVLKASAPAVILATGGYTTNFDLVDKRLHTTMANNLSVSAPRHDGAGILMAAAGVLAMFQEITAAISPDGSGLIGALDALAANGADNVFKGETLEELAANAPFDTDAFLATVRAYNDACDAGFDPAYFKRADQLVKLEQGPFYAFRWDLYVTTSINGIHTSRNAEALRSNETPIPGLYVVGMDGCELYDGFYTISTPGSANAFNVHSGRVAARHAVDYAAGYAEERL